MNAEQVISQLIEMLPSCMRSEVIGIIEQQQYQISELKKKVAYEQDRIDCRNTVCMLNRNAKYTQCNEFEVENETLKLQLSEKDKEIERLKSTLNCGCGICLAHNNMKCPKREGETK